MRKNKYRTNIFFSTWTKTHNTKCFPLHLLKHGMFISLISQVEYLQNSKFWWTFHDFLSQQAETIQQTAWLKHLGGGLTNPLHPRPLLSGFLMEGGLDIGMGFLVENCGDHAEHCVYDIGIQ